MDPPKIRKLDMQRPRGFTLFELAIVLVIISIPATILIVNYTATKDRQKKEATVIRNAHAIKQALESNWAHTRIYPDYLVVFHRPVAPGDLVPDLEYRVGRFKNPFIDTGNEMTEPSNQTIPGSLIYAPAKDRRSYLIYGIGAKGDTIITLESFMPLDRESPFFQN